mgnify:FL=1
MTKAEKMVVNSHQIKPEIFFDNFLDFENSRPVSEDCKHFQMGAKMNSLSLSFIRGFQYKGKCYYETKLDDGHRVLHQWSVSSSINRGSFYSYVWLNNS